MQVDLINHFGVFMGSGDNYNFFGNSLFLNIRVIKVWRAR